MNSDDIPICEPDQIRQDCARKLRAVQVSTHFQAILGCLLGEDWTMPRLVEMVITPDGNMLGRPEGEPSFKAFLGETDDLIRNIHGAAKVAELDGALLESETLRKQASLNPREQFSNSSDLKTAILNVIMEALEAHTTMST